MFCRNTNSFQWELAWSCSSCLNFQSHNIFFPHRCSQVHRSFNSVQGPAGLLYATKALANLVTSLLGPNQSGEARSTDDFGFVGELTAGRDGAQGSNRAILTSRKGCFLQANTCSTSAFLQ